MTRIGRKVLHTGLHRVGTVIEQHADYVTLLIEGRRSYLVNRICDQNYITERNSFTYKPGDRG